MNIWWILIISIHVLSFSQHEINQQNVCITLSYLTHICPIECIHRILIINFFLPSWWQWTNIFIITKWNSSFITNYKRKHARKLISCAIKVRICLHWNASNGWEIEFVVQIWITATWKNNRHAVMLMNDYWFPPQLLIVDKFGHSHFKWISECFK